MPACWKERNIVFLLKQAIPVHSSEWRPITLQSAVYKVYGLVCNKKLLRFLLRNQWIAGAQLGFVPIEGCLEQIASVRNVIQNVKMNKKRLYCVFLDFANAYGSLDHDWRPDGFNNGARNACSKKANVSKEYYASGSGLNDRSEKEEKCGSSNE